MTRQGLAIIFLTLPLWGNDWSLQTTNTERVNLAPGATIRVTGSHGDLNVEGWDRPEVEITVTKLVWDTSKSKRDHLEHVEVVTKRNSDTELTVSTVTRKRSRGVTMQYEIHAPRDSMVVIRHGTGSVLVNDVSGDVDATCHRGDIILMLREKGTYSIDAQSKLGLVISDS